MIWNKYGNKKVTTPDGTFDSKGEHLRWLFLKDAERRGEIRDLRRQVTYQLVPAMHYTETVHLKTKDKQVQRVWTRPVTYTADFVYKILDKSVDSALGPIEFWTTVVEDFKGMPNDRWQMKKALMAFVHGIYVREVKRPAEPITQPNNPYHEQD